MTGLARRAIADDARLIVRAGNARYGIAAARVREIVRLPRITPVPLGPPMLHGLGNVRGETLAILGPAREASAKAGRPRQLLVLEGPDRIGIAVDVVEKVERRAAGSARVRALPIDSWIGDAFPVREAAKRAAGPRQTQARQQEERLVLLHFQLGDQNLALPLEHVGEVIGVPQAIATLPGADDAVIGTMLWRDRTIGLLSPAALLGFGPGAVPSGALGGPARRVVIVTVGGHISGLLVDRLEGLLRIAPDRIDPVPPSLQLGASGSCIAAICRRENGGGLVSVLAAEHLLGEASARQLAAKSERAAVGDADRVNAVALLLLVIGNHRLALPVATVEQVVLAPGEMTRLPNAPDWLSGLAHIGGAPLVIIDQVLRLTGRATTSARRRLVIVRADDERVGFLVDEAPTILHVDRAALAPAPLPQALAGGVFGEALAIGEDGDTLLLLDPAAMMSSAEQDLVRAVADHGAVAAA